MPRRQRSPECALEVTHVTRFKKTAKSLTANMETDQLEDLKRTLADAFSVNVENIRELQYRGPYTKTTELSPLLSDIHMEDFKNAFSSTTSKKPWFITFSTIPKTSIPMATSKSKKKVQTTASLSVINLNGHIEEKENINDERLSDGDKIKQYEEELKRLYQSPTESDRLVWRTKEGEFEITKVMLGIWARYIHLNMHGTTLLSPPNTRQFSLDNLKKVKKQPLNDSNSNQGLADAVKELAAQLLLRPANTIALSAPEHSLKTIPVASTPPSEPSSSFPDSVSGQQIGIEDLIRKCVSPDHFEWIFGICKEECITVETLEDSLAAELVAVKIPLGYAKKMLKEAMKK
ncbi:hypothetical protein DFJ73DRAFT_758533 [Zopfochytrium polystomum]|nr:hypothetical protein DFJ73DRAFT_758533 [Zopfochytrium polystomum]